MKPTITEQTAKRWKLIQVIGVFAILVGAVYFFLGMADSMAAEKISEVARKEAEYAASIAKVGTGILIGLAGILAYLVGRIGGWWCHG